MDFGNQVRKFPNHLYQTADQPPGVVCSNVGNNREVNLGCNQWAKCFKSETQILWID